MYLSTLAIALALLACDQSPTATGNAVIGTWVADGAVDHIEIWSIREDGLFSRFGVLDNGCYISNGRWETSNSNIWITLYPSSRFSEIVRGTYKVKGDQMIVVDADDKNKTLWRRTEEAPFNVMISLGHCVGDPDEVVE